ncbi:zinc finger MYM-type protein 5-like [Limulus polyphemus]|uniref:Zinc finger MYM-type protein 5-like n=1 Tax=Limulus polyphemus TaxID=6850 RepID=A0ABM1BQR1_LIMPO|nr:zinc finger MYM-type protein 5-like [Limulus polyphemus]
MQKQWEVNANLLKYYADHIPSQNLDADFDKSGRQFGDNKRFVQKEYFYRHMANGEIIRRDWLTYLPSAGKVFCYVCKLFSYDEHPNQFETGLDDWKNSIARIYSHEQSKYHLHALSNKLQHQKATRTNAEVENAKQKTCRFWFEVLKRIVAVVKFLPERGLAFRGDNEIIGSPNYGNFIGCIKLLAEFDPFLQEHVEKF